MGHRVITDERLTDADDRRDLRGAEVVGCTIEGVSAESLSLEGIRFEACRFLDCHLRLATVTGSRLDDTGFLRCTLTGIDWTRAAWSRFAIGPGLRFVDCTLDYGSFAGLTLPGTSFHGSRAVDVDFGGCDLAGADLRFCDLSAARFDGASLEGATLAGATGYALDLDQVRVRGCVVSLPEAAVLLEGLGLVVAPLPERTDPETLLG